MAFEKVLTRAEFRQRVEELVGVKFPLLSAGYIMLQDAMGGDAAVLQAARTTSDLQPKGAEADEILMRYLMRHRHGTPSEFAQVAIEVMIPMDAHRQFVRHRMASINEYSTRYSPAIDVADTTPEDAWRTQSTTNRQGSGGSLTAWPEGWTYDSEQNRVASPDGSFTMTCNEDISTPGKLLSLEERELQQKARQVYDRRLQLGVAKEQARKDLPLSTYTKLWWTADLRNIFHFLGLRMDSHAQKEIREYATTFGEKIIKHLFPCSYQAFEHYELKAMRLSALDIEVVRKLPNIATVTMNRLLTACPPEWQGARCRERDELVEKLRRLGFSIEDAQQS